MGIITSKESLRETEKLKVYKSIRGLENSVVFCQTLHLGNPSIVQGLLIDKVLDSQGRFYLILRGSGFIKIDNGNKLLMSNKSEDDLKKESEETKIPFFGEKTKIATLISSNREIVYLNHFYLNMWNQNYRKWIEKDKPFIIKRRIIEHFFAVYNLKTDENTNLEPGESFLEVEYRNL